MSIKKSLRMSILLIAALPIILMTFLTYTISYSKYLDMAKASAENSAKTYGEGFYAQLNVIITKTESLSNTNVLQQFALEVYNNNGISFGTDSNWYTPVKEILANASSYFYSDISFYLYDVNGYFLIGSSGDDGDDWGEYMSTPVSEIKKTTLMKSSNINKTSNSIEIIAPVSVKSQIVGLIRCNIPSTFFGAFLPDSSNSFILTETNEYLFSSTGFYDNPKLESTARNLFKENSYNGYITNNEYSVKNIYGYFKIPEYGWLYILKQDGYNYEQILSTFPVLMTILLIIILIISVQLVKKLTNKYTSPILELKENMSEAAAGHLDVVCNIDSEDEFGELSHMFNDMMNIISTNYNQLDLSKKILESNEIELKKNYHEIEQLAYHDGLTGLYNRVAFIKYAYDIFHRDGAQLNKYAIFFIDLDNFKNVNDSLGHDYGDLLLKQVSERLSSCTCEEDILARTGGDEFLLLKTEITTINELEYFAEKLVDTVRMPFILDEETAHVSMSVGVALFPRDGLTINELIKNADIAMYSAKTSGKNRYKFFNSYMEDDFNRKNDLEEIISKAIEKNEVYLQYQPQVNIASGKITGYEALIRINSDIAGPISPTEFIPIAEETGLINQLGEWALYEACFFNKRLQDSAFSPLRVSVNISTEQLKNENLVEIIRSIPEKTGMELKYLEIEITESVLMNSLEHNLNLLSQIKAMGVNIALDDFGTGYSSFNYLTQLPIDTLKIDKSFIDGICNNEKDRCIADSIISLAHKLNISVVAEGIEHLQQLEILQSQSCDTIQGYLFSKPVVAADFINLLPQKNN